MSSTLRGRRGTKCGTCANCRKKKKCINPRLIIAHYKKTSCFVYIFFLIGYGALSLRFIWQTRKSIVGDTCDVSVPRDSSVKITPKIPAKFASLNSSIAFGDLRLGGCLRGPPSQAPARAQSPARNTRIKRRKIRGGFWGYLDVPGSGVFTPEFTVRAQSNKLK
jgi:hypothetical protein